MLVVDALDPADELLTHDLEPGLLGHFAHDRLGECLAGLDAAAGDRPLPRRRTVAAADEQQTLGVDGDGADAHLGRLDLAHWPTPGRNW